MHICIWIWIYNALHHSTVQYGTVNYIICTICIQYTLQFPAMIWMWYHSILSAPSHLGISKELPPSGCLGDCGADRRQRLATPKRVAGGMRVALMESGTKWVSQEDCFLPNLELSDLQSEVSRNCTRHWIIINPDGYSVSQPKVSSCYGDCKLLNMHRLRPSHNNFVSFRSKGRPVQPSVCLYVERCQKVESQLARSRYGRPCWVLKSGSSSHLTSLQVAETIPSPRNRTLAGLEGSGGCVHNGAWGTAQWLNDVEAFPKRSSPTESCLTEENIQIVPESLQCKFAYHEGFWWFLQVSQAAQQRDPHFFLTPPVRRGFV